MTFQTFRFKQILFLIGIFLSISIHAQDLEKEAHKKIKSIEKLIKKAEKKGIDVLKEKTTIRTAEVFLKYANWDENHIEANTKAFELVRKYKKNASEMVQNLADFERKDVVLMLDEATDNINLLLKKKAFRTPSPNVDWTEAFVDGDQITFEGKPVFLFDYTWKPKTKELTEFHGNQDGFFLTPSYVTKEDGTINKRIMTSLIEKKEGSLGFIFLNHKNTPKWAEQKYGPGFKMRTDTYTAYDIDNPGAKDVQEKLLAAVVPKMAGKKFSELGYMLCNEPHFFTQKTGDKVAWASGPVSKYTIDKFKTWLQQKHVSIGELNALWKTDFKDFSEVKIEIPMDTSLIGSAIWYDWSLFNMNRVTEWYSFLKSEIQKHDKEAKVHLKIMPNLWTDNQRVHGIDLEALTDLSGIIGNDSGAHNNDMWGKKEAWEDHYAFEWRELCMGFDFMKSVSPNKINFNSELHYLSTVKSRDLYQDPAYARATFWLAYSHGMTASQIWYWPREANGAISKKAQNDKGYAGSNNQQPRVTNEVAMTMIDLNANSEEIMKMQRQRKSLRVFYSKTSAINKTNHMDDVFELYESLHFEGTPIGFVTKDILNNQDASLWDAVLVRETEFVNKDELEAIQKYLNKGGIVLLDEHSLLKDEYGNSLIELNEGKGKIYKLNSLEEFKSKALSVLKEKGHESEVSVVESNDSKTKGCVWKVVKNKKGNHVLSVVNVGKSDASIQISLKGASSITCTDLINGVEVSSSPVLKPYEVYFVEVVKR